MPPAAAAQEDRATLVIEVRSGDAPVAEADVVVRGLSYRTDADGRVTMTAVRGEVEILVLASGFAPETVPVTLVAGMRHEVVIELHLRVLVDEHLTVVAATRTNRRIEDQAMRVEVVGRDEIEEKMLMTPGDIVMMLNEMGGMRVQATSPALGAATVRIQGMRGRHTRVLSDGLPLYGDAGGIGLLQIPPMDLGQVEVIKGVSSALYGAGALGGVVNLLSRRPGAEPAYEGLVNRSSRGATDAVAFVSRPVTATWGATLLAGGHWHETSDVTADGWADVPGYTRAVLRPRLFMDNGGGRSIFATAGVTYEDRTGGTIPGHVLSPTGSPYVQALDTRRYDAGASAQLVLQDRLVVTLRGAVVRQRHDHQFGAIVERDRHDGLFGEATVRGNAGRGTWVAGTAIERDAFMPRDVPRFAYTFTVPGVFGQYDVDLTPALAVSSSVRLDAHSEYGTFFNPRVSALARTGRWTGRFSMGTGFFPATALTEETGAAGLTGLEVEGTLDAARGVSASADISRIQGPLTLTVTLFRSRITSPVHVNRTAAYVIRNLEAPIVNTGGELLGVVRSEPWAITATYTYVRARETVLGVRQDVPLTPRHSAGIVGMWEREDVGRVGVEWYYTGAQRLEENPYRSTSEPYTIVGALAERWFGRTGIFINAENLTGVRQTRWDPLLRPWRAADGRWTVDAWAPLEGRTFNGGLRLRF